MFRFRHAAATATVAAALAFGCAQAQAASLTPAVPAPVKVHDLAWAHPDSATPLPVVYSFIPCINGNGSWQCPRVKPVGLVLGMGVIRIARMSWHVWNQTSASATDLTTIDDCIPNCAMGHDHTYRGSMYLHGIRSHNGRHYFYLMTWRYVKNGVTHGQRLTYGVFPGGRIDFWH